MDFALEMEGLNTIAADFAAAGPRLAAAAVPLLAKTGADIEADGKAFAPVDTGALKNSIGWELELSHAAVVVGPTVEYGAHVEFGTVNMAPHAYMGPALDRRGPEFMEAVGVLAVRLGQ